MSNDAEMRSLLIAVLDNLTKDKARLARIEEDIKLLYDMFSTISAQSGLRQNSSTQKRIPQKASSYDETIALGALSKVYNCTNAELDEDETICI